MNQKTKDLYENIIYLQEYKIKLLTETDGVDFTNILNYITIQIEIAKIDLVLNERKSLFYKIKNFFNMVI